MSAIPAPPPIHDDEIVQYFGFPFKDDSAFYRANVDPSWVPQEGEEPDLEEALYHIKRATGFDHMNLVSVWSDERKGEIDFMLAVASAEKGTDTKRIAKWTEEQLKFIAEKTNLNGVQPRWMRSLWVLEDLRGMNVPEL
ncbi:hypothetical protein BDZ97DRAFT_1755195 [Flammula alnicola]|nr:hypothetical protein BDZ97DRAFT_1755195 [Flammula alnicola]